MEGARPFLDADFPGYAEAVARENSIRGAACLGLNEEICGLEVKPMNAAHMRLLSLVGSPFTLAVSPKKLSTKPGIVDDIMLFLWIVSPMYQAGITQRTKWWHRKTARDRFNEAFSPIVKQSVEIVCAAIAGYIEEAFIDEDERPAESDKSYFAFEIGIALEMREHYGFRIDFWNPECPPDKNPLLVPLKLVFQLRKLRALQKHGASKVMNKSERFISIGLEAMNKADKEKTTPTPKASP